TAIGTGEMFSAPAPVTSSTYYLTQTIQGCESNAAVINVSKVVIDATIVYENGMLRVAETEGDFFEWFRNNGRVAFTSSTLPLNGLDGTYTVVVYKDGCYKQSKPFVVTGLPEESDAVDIFPNPASDRVFIDNVPGDYRLIVYSTEGRIMLDQKGTAGGRINFSVFNWSKGLYAVTVGFEGRKVVKRLVIE
ncbi:MAG TPA: T9SS type A sorting domain-containing protein, partial [Cyclobacteriaceae bacterium]|nr:T9SS type A sorting domain-containing protein [Cyclobacteriaceae bacterium]